MSFFFLSFAGDIDVASGVEFMGLPMPTLIQSTFETFESGYHNNMFWELIPNGFLCNFIRRLSSQKLTVHLLLVYLIINIRTILDSHPLSTCVCVCGGGGGRCLAYTCRMFLMRFIILSISRLFFGLVIDSEPRHKKTMQRSTFQKLIIETSYGKPRENAEKYP